MTNKFHSFPPMAEIKEIKEVQDAESEVIKEPKTLSVGFVYREQKKKGRREPKYSDYSVFPSNKRCPDCNECLPSTDFGIYYCKQRGKTRLQGRCRNCKTIHSMEIYREQSEWRKAKIKEVMNGSGCPGCEARPVCGTVTDLMDFAHYKRGTKYETKNGNTKNWSQMSIPQMKKEWPLGRLLCMLCHFFETQSEIKDKQLRGPKQRAYDYLNKRKLELKECADCGMEVKADTVGFFQFDHRDGKHGEDDDYIGMLALNGASNERLDEEMKKCDFVDAECHRRRTNERFKQHNHKCRPVKVGEFI